MSSDSSDTSGAHEPDPSGWEDLLRSMFGGDSEEALRQMRANGLDPEALSAASGMMNDPKMLEQVLAQVQRLLAASGGAPVNSDVAHDVARQAAVSGGDPSLTPQETRAATGALSVAELWLDAATDLPPAGGPARAWSRSEWVEHTLPAWNALAEPVAASVAEALSSVLRDQLPDLGGAGGALPPGLFGGAAGIDPAQMVRQLGAAVFGMQVGAAAGTLSREVFGATDIGVPLLPDAATVLVPANISDFAEGLDAPGEEVRLFLALREAAHARLFTHVTWLRSHLLGLVNAYARGITIDMDALESSLREVDPTDADALRGALSGGVFGIESTEEQQATLLRLETVLALVEGWVDEVVARAALPHLPHAAGLREMIRRRRAAGGPAEQTFASLVGLELRPRRSRDAATFFATVEQEDGPGGRDAVWEHPDLLPTPADLDDPAGFLARRKAPATEDSDLDRALAEIFAADDEAHAGDGGQERGAAQDGAGSPDDGGAPDGHQDGPDRA